MLSNISILVKGSDPIPSLVASDIKKKKASRLVLFINWYSVYKDFFSWLKTLNYEFILPLLKIKIKIGFSSWMTVYQQAALGKVVNSV